MDFDESLVPPKKLMAMTIKRAKRQLHEGGSSVNKQSQVDFKDDGLAKLHPFTGERTKIETEFLGSEMRKE